jgi:hypothetical protein
MLMVGNRLGNLHSSPTPSPPARLDSPRLHFLWRHMTSSPPSRPRRRSTVACTRTIDELPACAVQLALAFAAASLAWADVSTTVSGTTLLVTGNDSADLIRIGSASDGVTVAGEDGTLVDGTTQVTIPGVQDLKVTLKRGRDHVTIEDLQLDNGLEVHSGSGNDRVALNAVHAGWTRIVTGLGFDRVKVIGFSRLGNLRVDTGGHGDVVRLDEVWVRSDLDVTTRGGDDYVEMVDTYVGDDVDVDLGDDDDDVVLADVTVDDDMHLDGDDGEDDAFFYGDVWWGGVLDLDGFDDDGWWWWW